MEKIAISTNAGGLEDVVCPTLGRCATFTIVEIENKEIKNTSTVTNPGTQMGSGAGIQAAQTIANSGATSVITGNVGPNAMNVISQAGIKVYSATGMNVKDAIQAYIAGTLQEITTTVQPFFGQGAGTGAGMGTGMGRGAGRGQAGGTQRPGTGRGAGAGRGAGQGRGRGKQFKEVI